MHLYGSLLPLAVNLLLSNTATAASVLRRDPSKLITLRHSEPEPASNQLPIPSGTYGVYTPEADDITKLINIRDISPSVYQVNQLQNDKDNKLTISGHGVVAVPITPEGEHIHVEIEFGSQIIDNNDDTTSADSEYIHQAQVGSITFQVIGPDLTITDNRDSGGVPGETSGDESDGAQGGLDDENGTENLTPGQLAAMAFAKAAEEIMANNQQDQVPRPRGASRSEVSST